MAVELEHSFTTAKPIADSFASILDLEQARAVRRGRSVLEHTGPESVRAQIFIKMGAMSMTFAGTLDVVEQDAAAHHAVMEVKSKEEGGRATRTPPSRSTWSTAAGRSAQRPDHRQGRIDGRRGRRGRARRADHRLRRQSRLDLRAMATIAMRQIREGEVPFDGEPRFSTIRSGRSSEGTAPTTTSASNAGTCSPCR